MKRNINEIYNLILVKVRKFKIHCTRNDMQDKRFVSKLLIHYQRRSLKTHNTQTDDKDRHYLQQT